MSDRLIWIWLSLSCGPGSRIYNKLFSSFSTLREIYEAPRERFMEIDGMTDKLADALADKDFSRAENILSMCISRNWTVLTYGDRGYPRRLKTLIDPPVVLYCKGRFLDLNDNVCIAVVGTRRMSEYGERQAYSLSYAMAAGGAVIVSGLALGCDAMAANGALDAGAPTIAVLGCGIDRVYPPQHRTLAEHIVKNGMIMTEYPPGSPPDGAHFPVRNRIISGLSQGTLVVEAPEGSGSLITARTALYQGRDLFAVPGQVGSKNSEGCNSLIKAGANTVTTATDVLSVYEFIYPHRINLESARNAERDLTATSGQATAALRHIASRPLTDAKKSRNSKKSNGADDAPQAISAAVEQNARAGFTQAEESFSFERDRRQRERHLDGDGGRPRAEAVQKSSPEQPSSSADNAPITKVEREVLGAIGDGPVTPDELCAHGFTPSEVMSALTILEILGLIAAVPGGRYVKTGS